MTNWLQKLSETFLETGYYQLMLKGFGNTLLITLGALCIGVVIGVLIASVKYICEGNQKFKWLVKLCDLYTTVIRGIPIVVLLLIFYYVILTSAHEVSVAVLTFGINSGAYMAELIRSGIGAVDVGQMEAGRSLGMTRFQATYKIIFPQALKYVLPTVGNEFIALLKETSVAGYVAIVDLTRAGNLVRNNTYDAVNTLLLVALTYLLLVVLLSNCLKAVERRLAKNDRKK